MHSESHKQVKTECLSQHNVYILTHYRRVMAVTSMRLILNTQPDIKIIKIILKLSESVSVV